MRPISLLILHLHVFLAVEGRTHSFVGGVIVVCFVLYLRVYIDVVGNISGYWRVHLLFGMVEASDIAPPDHLLQIVLNIGGIILR